MDATEAGDDLLLTLDPSEGDEGEPMEAYRYMPPEARVEDLPGLLRDQAKARGYDTRFRFGHPLPCLWAIFIPILPGVDIRCPGKMIEA